MQSKILVLAAALALAGASVASFTWAQSGPNSAPNAPAQGETHAKPSSGTEAPSDANVSSHRAHEPLLKRHNSARLHHPKHRKHHHHHHRHHG